MRLDSSGNLLVGKTSTAAGAGVIIGASGVSNFTADGDRTLILNRETSDGDILEFRKDNSKVGSIGAANGNTYYSFNSTKAITTDGASDIVPCTSGGVKQVGGYMSLGSSSYPFNDLYLSGDAKIGTSGRTTYAAGGFYDNAASGNNIGIVTGGNHVFLSDGNGTATDNVNDLGSTSRRIRDIYVGGGVYLGGTGAANKLDDYEEGTFTPVLEGTTTAGTGTYTTQFGQYTKIGDTVFIRIYLAWTAHTGTGDTEISGLPFTANATRTAPLSSWASEIAYTTPPTFFVSNSTTKITGVEQVNNNFATGLPLDTSGAITISGSYHV
jgi:hypothetical protein